MINDGNDKLHITGPRVVTFQVDGNITATELYLDGDNIYFSNRDANIYYDPNDDHIWVSKNLNLDGNDFDNVGNIYSNGDITAQGNITAAGFYESSDKRLKYDLEELPLDLCKKILKTVQPIYFKFKDDEDKKRHIGIIAQELLEICPELVIKGEDGYYRVAYDKLSVILMKVVASLI